ncbi:type II toxin-antitoxin system VapC family toxin [Ferrovibrio sp.]|uniref:type II toxin-antitoxin system VapC family toxin n=1 Tax=Ferrovibrio sp. TaxID=1917215 RepID=UPI001B50AE10|nr:type II toxin-antitoxin system VapC family toxin [Ferrovibrio sp.]MBP7065242.1 type II toxin-antitoxin system VapC family toxin [Ferrovibrio sp.]
MGIGATHRAGLRKLGQGEHQAALNFGDCFAYEVAREHGCSLLYVGADFSRTDVAGIL